MPQENFGAVFPQKQEGLSDGLNRVINLPSHYKDGMDKYYQDRGVQYPADPKAAEEAGKEMLLKAIQGDMGAHELVNNMVTLLDYPSMKESTRREIYKTATLELIRKSEYPDELKTQLKESIEKLA